MISFFFAKPTVRYFHTYSSIFVVPSRYPTVLTYIPPRGRKKKRRKTQGTFYLDTWLAAGGGGQHAIYVFAYNDAEENNLKFWHTVELVVVVNQSR